MIFNQGASFKGWISAVGAVCFIVLIGFTVVALKSKGTEGLNANSVLPFSIPAILICFSLMLNIEGVELDLESQRIRTYHKYYFLKFGEWQSLNDYNQVNLKIDRFTYTSGPFMISSSHQKQNFDVFIMNKESGNSILLEECMSYAEGKDRLSYFGTLFNLEKWDQVSIDLDHAKMRRRK